jgi:hypothetical protein
MRHGQLTRDQAIAAVGLRAVDLVDTLNCDFTNRLQTDGDEAIEFSATVSATDRDDSEVRLVAFHYQMPDALAAAGDDLSNCDWAISGYEIR